MLQINFIKENKGQVINGLKIRNFADEDLAIVERVIAIDEVRRSSQTELDNSLAESNRISKEIGNLFKQGKKEEADVLKNQVTELKTLQKNLSQKLNEAQDQMETELLNIPNIPHSSVPAGKLETDNEVYKVWGNELPEMDQEALPHWELAKKYDLFDMELGVKITGAGYRGKGAKLQRALINFFLDEADVAGYEEIIPPHLVNEASARGTGQLPDKEGQMYHATKDDLYLIPTAEVPITNMYRDMIVSEKDFPIKLTGYTPCFRREAGSYGAHVRGLNRVHQFDKVEIVRIEHPDKSYDALKDMDCWKS